MFIDLITITSAKVCVPDILTEQSRSKFILMSSGNFDCLLPVTTGAPTPGNKFNRILHKLYTRNDGKNTFEKHFKLHFKHFEQCLSVLNLVVALDQSEFHQASH